MSMYPDSARFSVRSNPGDWHVHLTPIPGEVNGFSYNHAVELAAFANAVVGGYRPPGYDQLGFAPDERPTAQMVVSALANQLANTVV